VDAFLGGWQLSNFLFFETGNPINVGTSGDNLNTGGSYLQVPNRIAEANLEGSERTRTRFFNTDAFVRPAQYQLGNAGRRIIIGPGSSNLDLSFVKQFLLTESKSLQFRAELFNATNHPNWGAPGTTLGSASFGLVTSNSNLPRQMQMGLSSGFSAPVAPQHVLDQPQPAVSLQSEDGLRVELHGLDGQLFVPHAHDHAVIGFGRHFQALRERLPAGEQRVVAAYPEALRQPFENAFALVDHGGRFPVHGVV